MSIKDNTQWNRRRLQLTEQVYTKLHMRIVQQSIKDIHSEESCDYNLWNKFTPYTPSQTLDWLTAHPLGGPLLHKAVCTQRKRHKTHPTPHTMCHIYHPWWRLHIIHNRHSPRERTDSRPPCQILTSHYRTFRSRHLLPPHGTHISFTG